MNRLRLFFDAAHSDVFIYNLAISGNNTRDILERFDREAKPRQPDAIIISAGDNDSVHSASKKGNIVPIDEFAKNIQKLAKKAKKLSGKVVFLGCKKVDEAKTTPIPWRKDYSYRNELLRQYNSRIREVAEREGCHFLDVFDVLKNGDLEDGLHPNSRGHQKLFSRISKFLADNSIP